MGVVSPSLVEGEQAEQQYWHSQNHLLFSRDNCTFLLNAHSSAHGAVCVCIALILGHGPYPCPLRPPFLKLNLPAGFFPGNSLASCTGGFSFPSFCHDSIARAPAQAIPIAVSLGAGCPRRVWPPSHGVAQGAGSPHALCSSRAPAAAGAALPSLLCQPVWREADDIRDGSLAFLLHFPPASAASLSFCNIY